jgi:putative nucleotidyltransferase-like protein
MPLRFRPPRLALPAEVRWMLLRAFAPREAPFADPVEPVAALAVARRFEVAARIIARQGRERLAGELGSEVADGFGRSRVAATAAGLRLMALARRVAELAATLGAPIAFLKFVALEGSGLLAAGSRDACDVDVLVPGSQAGELWRTLVAAGWRRSGLRETEHHLPALAHPEAGTIEIHRRLLGVRPHGRSSATFESLDRAGLLDPLRGFAGRCSTPSAAVQSAHVLVHGLGQHGYWPESYSLLKMVADLLDLGSLGVEGSIPPWLRWVERDVPVEEAGAVRRLCARLAAGEDPAGWQGPEETLLRHIVAGRLDPEYERALRLGLFRAQPSDRSRPAQLARTLFGAVLLSDAQIDALYGRPRSRLGYLGHRLARPFDLLLRLGRYGAKWVRVQR